MPLPDDYLTYPHRTAGMDNPHYGWDPLQGRAPLHLPDGTKTLATVIVPIEFFPLTPPATPLKHPGAMKTPYPDLRHYTVRDYGNRVGVFRLLELFDSLSITATFAVNAEVARRYPPLIEAITSAGHEIAAHGVSTAHIHHDGLSEAEEQALVSETRSVFPSAVTWMSPARNASYRTMDLLAEAGFSVTLDWEADMRPLAFKTRSNPITALPHYNELGDVKLLTDRSHAEAAWRDQLIEAGAYHIGRHAAEGASAFAFTLTPYVAGQPFRIKATTELLSGLAGLEGLRFATAQETAAAFQSART
ncbi:MAG: polysaccharide deacetylase family protein [Pseudomonadota bacterium]